MRKEVFKYLKEEIINNMLCTDEVLAECDELIRNIKDRELNSGNDFLDEIFSIVRDSELENYKDDLNTRVEKAEKSKKIRIQKLLSWFNIGEDENNNLYVLLNYSGSKLLSYYHVETGEVKYISDNDEQYNFIKNNYVIYPEDLIGISEKEKEYRVIKRYKKLAEEIRYNYYCDAVRSDLDQAKILMLHKYSRNDENEKIVK